MISWSNALTSTSLQKISFSPPCVLPSAARRIARRDGARLTPADTPEFIASASGKHKHLMPARRSIAEHGAGTRTWISGTNEGWAVDGDQLRGAAGRPVADQLDVVAEPPQRSRRGLAKPPFQLQVLMGPRGLGAHSPPGRIHGRLHRHAPIHQVGNDLQVRLHLPEGARSA